MTNAPLRILVVEDDPLILMDVVDRLRGSGFDVTEASTADEAVVLLAADPHVLVTDIDMPGYLNGLDLAFVAETRWPPVQVIVTSGNRSVTPDQFPDGTVYFAKPYRIADLITAIKGSANNP